VVSTTQNEQIHITSMAAIGSRERLDNAVLGPI
jgi:hypothetical protein